MALFSILFLIISGIAIIKSAGHFSIFGLAVSDKLSALPATPVIYMIIIFVLALVALFVSLSARKIVY